MQADFRALLIAGGVLTAAKVNWTLHPQGQAFPGVVLTLIDNFGGHTLDGPTSLRSARVQVDVYASEQDATHAIANQIESILDGHIDSRFQGIFLLSRTFRREEADPERLFRASLDWDVRWNRT